MMDGSSDNDLLVKVWREVPDDVYKSLDAVKEDEKWWEAVDLQKLILAHNNLETLSENLRNLSLLTVLNVSHNKLSSLPSAVGELASLKLLDVSFNSIVSLPEEIGSASSLVKLHCIPILTFSQRSPNGASLLANPNLVLWIDCSNNLLEELPCSLGNCNALSELKASNNSIQNLPDQLVNCSKLYKLDIEGNKLAVLSESLLNSWILLTEFNSARNLLTCIPDSIGVLSKLVRLDLHQNKISSIPSSIKGCSSLTEFYVGTNLLSSLPAEIGALSSLRILDLHSNQLKEFTTEACELRLSVLDLSNNSLSGLPFEIGKMTTLRKLLLSGNPIRTLRSSLVSGPTPMLLKYLRSRLPTSEEASNSTPTKDDQIAMATSLSLSSKELSLSGLGLTNVPPAVWETSEVEKVDLSKNSIEVLPSEMAICSSLQTLVLSCNKLKEWPSSIFSSLPNLTCLKLDKNPLTQIPVDGFKKLSKLEILDLSGNASSLPDPSILSSLLQLQELYLRRVQLQLFPLSLLSLQKLRILDLSQNTIISIPEDIKKLATLAELDLSDNDISTLPPELGLLEPTLQVLRLDGNPMRSIRRTILDRGTKAVLKYLRDKLPE